MRLRRVAEEVAFGCGGGWWKANVTKPSLSHLSHNGTWVLLRGGSTPSSQQHPWSVVTHCDTVTIERREHPAQIAAQWHLCHNESQVSTRVTSEHMSHR